MNNTELKAIGLRGLFLEIWPKLQELALNIQLLGGLSLFFKQEWIRDTKQTCFLPMEHWSRESLPRTTKDMDVGVSAHLIADTVRQEQLQAFLDEYQFEPGPHNKQKRWAWVHRASGILLEFSSTLPEGELCSRLKVEDSRVKNRSLHGKKRGIHGHVNAELVGFEYSFSFVHEGVRLTIPNVITAAVMKLKAFAQRRQLYEDDPKANAWQRAQYEKHARDVYRIVAMMTHEEAESLPEIQKSVADSEPFRECQENIRAYFLQPQQEGYEAAVAFWNEDDFALLREGLKRLFLL